MASDTTQIDPLTPSTGVTQLPIATSSAPTAPTVPSGPSSQLSPLVNPVTNQPFRIDENPFEGGASTSDLTMAKIFQEDYISSFKNIPKATSDVTISDGSEKERDKEKQSQSEAEKLRAEAEALDSAGSKSLTAQKDEFERLLKESRTLNEYELAQIDKEAVAAGLEYDPLIGEARESGRQGLAKAVVGAGERGGFMNTQFAGQAALTPTEGGTFVGAGGELSKIKGQLELVVYKLEIAKKQAIASARSAAEKAMRTGKREHLSDAKDLFTMAKDIANEQQQSIDRKIQLIQLEDQQTNSAFNRTKTNQDQAQQNLQYMITTFGAEAILNNPAEIDRLAKASGYDTGAFTDGLKTLKQKELEAKLANKPKPDLREVNGSLYAISYDANNKPVSELIIQAKPKATGSSTGATSKDYDAQLQALEASKGDDGYVNTDTYKRLRLSAKDKASFDKNFAHKLNTADPSAQALMQKQSSESQWEAQKPIWAELATPAGQSMTDEQKAQYIQANGMNPSDFGIDF